MPLTQQAIQSFLDYLKFQKRYSRNTIISYEFDLVSFFDYVQLQYNESTLEVKPAWVRSWLANLKSEEISSRTLNRKISCLKSFYKHLMRNGTVNTSPMGSIISPRISKKLPQYVEKKGIETLFTDVEFPSDFGGLTARLILELLYSTGMRQAELIGLKEGSVDYGNRSLKLFGKGGKERVVPVSAELVSLIKNYVAEKRKLIEQKDEGFLLVGGKGKKLYPRQVYDIVKKYLSLVTTIDKKSPHVLRHTFATHLTNNGADLNAVKELLGHCSLAATQVYTHNSIQQLKDVYKKAHPKA